MVFQFSAGETSLHSRAALQPQQAQGVDTTPVGLDMDAMPEASCVNEPVSVRRDQQHMTHPV